MSEQESGCAAVVCAFLLGGLVGIGAGLKMGSHEQGVRDALAGKYVVVQLPDGSSVVVENKEQGK